MNELWKEIPLFMKLIWFFGAILSLGIMGFIIWVIIKFMFHFGVI